MKTFHVKLRLKLKHFAFRSTRFDVLIFTVVACMLMRGGRSKLSMVNETR